MANQHTVVVGGTRGIGRKIALTLADEGHTVSVIGRQIPQDQEESAVDISHWAVDLLDANQRESALANVSDHAGPITNLIFCQRFRGESDDWNGELEASLTATKDLIECFSQRCENYSQNSVVVISSVASSMVAAEQPLSYHVGKAGLSQLVRYYAVKLGSKGIRVNSISPGLVLKDEAREFYRQNESLHRLFCSITPLGRMATPEDIAQIAGFLCSSKSSFITGQDIVADGGLSLQMQHALAREVTDL